MMIRVNLEILRGPYQPALAAGHQIDSCRLLTDLSLLGNSSWTPFRPAVVDTGAPISMLPRRIWRQADARVLGRFQVGGITRRPECMIDVSLASVVMAIGDASNQIAPIEAYALLADADDVPILLGMKSVLTGLVLHTDIKKSIAFIEQTP